jgi:geranylgeranyl diphosphate synthase type II
VADALGETQPAVTDAAAASLELIHCASLVHDDLPCFDDAATRRGRPSVHAAFGQAIAVLTGDALILGAMETLTLAEGAEPALVRGLVRRLCVSAGAPLGMCAGQAWESESNIDLERYHAAKTSTLLEAASCFGALVTGYDPEPWIPLGSNIGAAYQIADDIRDVTDDPTQLGKPVGRDRALGRPSMAQSLGVEQSKKRLGEHIARALDSIPPCPGRATLIHRVSTILEELRPR